MLALAKGIRTETKNARFHVMCSGPQAALAIDNEAGAAKGGLMTSEERSTGAVEGRVYREYFSAMGQVGALIGLVTFFLVSNFSVQLQQWWVERGLHY